MLKIIIFIASAMIFILACAENSAISLNSKDFYYKYYRNFSFYTQNFNEEIQQETLAKFCYKVYYFKRNGKRAAFEFINEKNVIEFLGYFNISETLKSVEVLDSSRGRMNMTFFYTPENILKQVQLLDDNKKIFAYGRAQYSANKKLLFIVFRQAETNQNVMYVMFRTNDKGNDEEIATYSSEGMLFSNHLFFYNNNGKLIRYEFYRKLNYVIGLKLSTNGFIREIYGGNRRFQGSFPIE